ncbi:hypothetical protein PN498_13255 [Oscillatoria sp. CS-180]|uniref:hypothetical protein n=1 Tax=Oscillatoria sp. CS-180 TaxID=3021720 RepID=UPI002330007D|nr:hypothetical protein [Oscillatoria sp. CS-180]MDB9526961.1 hypothetical protein [Oscillatoria sp. CS-180]
MKLQVYRLNHMNNGDAIVISSERLKNLKHMQIWDAASFVVDACRHTGAFSFPYPFWGYYCHDAEDPGANVLQLVDVFQEAYRKGKPLNVEVFGDLPRKYR